jgi:hypothetical protein
MRSDAKKFEVNTRHSEAAVKATLQRESAGEKASDNGKVFVI